MAPRSVTLILAALGALAGAAPASAAVLKVDDNGVQCPSAGFTTIQSAVNAAGPGDTIKVCPGSYAQEVTIPAGKNGLTLNGPEVATQATLSPSPGSTPDGVESLLTVDGSTGVRIRQLAFTGTISSCSSGPTVGIVGVEVSGGSATLQRDTFRGLRADDDSQCTSGSVEFDSDGAGTVANSTITDPSGAGVVDESSDLVVIKDNTITNPDAIDGTEQYGVIAGGAVRVLRNNISGFTPTGMSPFPSAAIGVQGATGQTRVTGNTISESVVGLLLISSLGGRYDDNTITGATGGLGSANGIVAQGVTGATFSGNSSTGNSLDCADSSTGNKTAGTANTWINDTGDTSDPAGICTPSG